MSSHRFAAAFVLVFLAHQAPAAAQFVDSLKRAARSAAEHEARRKVAELVRDGVRCVFDDFDCIRRAEANGKTAVMTDDGGAVLVDGDGTPITDPEEASRSAAAPGTGPWTAYDYVPGEQVLFAEDFAAARTGQVPDRLRLVRGNWRVVEQRGRAVLQSTGPAGAALTIDLPGELPQRFTIEVDVRLPQPNARLGLATTAPSRRLSSLQGNWWQIGERGTGIAKGRGGGEALLPAPRTFGQDLVPVRILVDGTLSTVFVRERRVATVPNGEFPRGGPLYIEIVGGSSNDRPVSIGRIQVASGGGDVAGALTTLGRVTTRGILFANGNDRIRPESTPTLWAIGRTLQQNPSLRVSIETHTTDEGDDARALTQRRADAVRQYLLTTFRLDDDRIEARGLGDTRPVADGATPEGREQNRRTEIVRRDR